MRIPVPALVLVIGLSLAGNCRTAWPEGASELIGDASSAAAKAGASFPNQEGSLRFAAFGDFGTGDSGQYRLAARMAEAHTTFPFEIAVLVGDNIYGSERPQDFRRKFEAPYKPLLDKNVKFYASLGNHDSREQRFYEHFNMNGEFYYSFKAPRQDVRFFALETTYLEPEQVRWLDEELGRAGEDWKIVFFHHAIYSSGGRHGSDEALREVLEPLFVKHGVSVVFAGHDHHYERTKPQQGITYFVTGSGGKLRFENYQRGLPFSEVVVADTLVFLLGEIIDDTLTFKAIAIDGRIVDEGTIIRRGAEPAPEVVAAPPIGAEAPGDWP